MSELTIEPHPWGKRFAVSLVDDTDRATEAEVREVYALLRDLGLSATKTVWPLEATASSGGYAGLPLAGDTLQQPGYRRLCQELQAQGFEIAMHTASAGDSRRPETIRAYELFEAIFGAPPVTNVMHGRNRENLYWGKHAVPNRFLARLIAWGEPLDFCGHDPASPYYWGDLCRTKSRYVRQFETLATDTLRFDPATPYHDPSKPDVPFWFSATYGSGARLFTLLTEPRLDELARRRSASILHTYLCRYTLPEGGGFIIDPRFRALAQRLASHPNAWVVPVATLLDRRRALRALGIESRGGELRLTNRSAVPLEALAVSALAGAPPELGTEAGPLTGNAWGQLLVGTLAPGESVRLLTRGSAPSCRPLPAPPPRINRLGLGTLSRVLWQFGHGRRRLVSNSDPARARRFVQVS